jgi:hypothetical protein
MTTILKTTLATAFAVACLASGTASFAANNNVGGVSRNVDGHPAMSRNSPDATEKLDYGTTGSITTCDKKDSIQHASCFHGLPKFLK